MKRLIICLTALLCGIPPLLHAQEGFSYAYDAAGNRTSRTVVLGTRSATKSSDTTAVAPPAKESTPSSPFFEESLGGRQIRIYPNPVAFELNVTVTNYEPAMKGDYSLYNMGGMMLLHRRFTGATARIDMSRYPKGVYILNIRLNGQSTGWKIIKQ